MMRALFVLFGVLGLVIVSGPSFAEEQLLNLWPNQRSSHQADMDVKADEYGARGKSYTDFLYSMQGEQEFPEADNIHASGDLYPGQAGSVEVDPEEVNLKDVQSILSDGTEQ